MTSSPLFISVLESTVIFGPMAHVGWANAWSTVTVASSGAVRPRNGPPLAVSRMRATSRSTADDERRHWWMAQCSLSTGTNSAPGVARNGCTTGPAAIRLSLLARASRLPCRSVAMVTGRPAKPTTALTTTSAGSARSSKRSTTVANGSADATSARRSARPTATTDGLNSLACSMSRSTDEPTPSATTSYWGASARTTSRVCVPIEPDEPAIATRTVTTRALLGPRLERQRDVVGDGQHEQEPVEAIEHTAAPAQQGAEVLPAEVALEHALGEVAERRHHGDGDGEDHQLAALPRVAAAGQDDDEEHDDGHQRPAD